MNTPQQGTAHDDRADGPLLALLRVLAVVLLVPVRGVWELLRWCGRLLRALRTHVLAPLGRRLEALLARLTVALVWMASMLFHRPWAALWRHVLAPALRYALLPPLLWFHRRVLAPCGAGLLWFARAVLVPPLAWSYRRLLLPLAAALAAAWRATGAAFRAVGRGLRWCGYQMVGRPAIWLHRAAFVPAGRLLRVAVWAPARDTWRRAFSTSRTKRPR
ncbi:hypothetical protein [Streptomyces sp. ODS05-4]|uniref:hypothetical protein n=1 Tax=Streptomyces sp. ODS05-4 TaxID=2944939 RepID=UPI00210CD76A|nr:hypothetical protein [Streptomyces sp. ODS05-4]